MQSGKYSVAVVVDGNLISERQDGLVVVPYGTDYAIRLRNYDYRRAVAVVYLDGINISEDGFVVGPNQFWDIERPANKQTKFRLVSSQSGAAYAAGKAGEDVDGSKGLIRVEWRVELLRPAVAKRPTWSCDWGRLGGSIEKGIILGDAPTSLPRGYTLTSNSNHYNDSPEVKCCSSTSFRSNANAVPMNSTLGTGVTVDGGYSSQQFHEVQMGELEPTATVIQLKLMGYKAEEGRPATGTNYCPACRTKTVKPTDRFCRSCGERL